MSNRRIDGIYFVLLLAVAAIGYIAANRASDDEGAILDLPDFDPPPLVLEVPFDFPYVMLKFENIVAPKLDLSYGMESALVEIRSALLESSTLVEVRPMGELVAANE